MPSYLNEPSDVNRTGHAGQVIPSLSARGSKLWDSAASGTFALVVPGATEDSMDQHTQQFYSLKKPSRDWLKPLDGNIQSQWQPLRTLLQNQWRSALTLAGFTSLVTTSAGPFQSPTPLTLRKLHQTSSRSAQVLPTFSFADGDLQIKELSSSLCFVLREQPGPLSVFSSELFFKVTHLPPFHLAFPFTSIELWLMAKILSSTRYYHLHGLMAKTISFQVKNRNSECPCGALFGLDETPQMNNPDRKSVV